MRPRAGGLSIPSLSRALSLRIARMRASNLSRTSSRALRLNMSRRILLIEDDPRLAEMVKSYLGEAGFAVSVAGKGAAGIALHGRESFDAIVLDLMLPDMDGLDVCQRIRANASTPILMLTARGDAMDRVVGLEL